MNELISQDSFATLLLCSYVIPKEKIANDYKPLSPKEWINLSMKIVKSPIERPSNLFNLSAGKICEILRVTSEESNRIVTLLSRGPSMALQIEKFSSMGIYVITRADKEYPKRFKKLLKAQSPNILYVAGDLDILNTDTLGIVGSRNANEDSVEFTKKITSSAVEQGYTIASGGSRGIDSIAHETAIKKNGKTIAILSDGLMSFLKNKETVSAILNKQMLVISPYHPNARFYSYTALERNKYIYTLSKCVVATSSDFKKGGTWAGAVENLKSSWVPLFTRKDDNSKGLSELVKLGAFPIEFDEIEKKVFRKIENIDNDVVAKAPKYEKLSIFDIVWPIIEKEIKEPIEVACLAERLDLEENQLNIWLRKAKSLGKIEYVNLDKVISSVFYNRNLDSVYQLNLFEQNS